MGLHVTLLGHRMSSCVCEITNVWFYVRVHVSERRFFLYESKICICKDFPPAIKNRLFRIDKRRYSYSHSLVTRVALWSFS